MELSTQKQWEILEQLQTGSTYGYESDHIPNWDEALDLWNKNFKEY